MATTYTGYIQTGADHASVFNRVYPIASSAITLPSNISGTATVKVTSAYPDGYLSNSALNATCESKIQLCDSAGNNAVTIFTKSIAASNSWYGTNTQTVDISGLKGKKLYGKVTPVTTSGTAGVIIREQLKIEITTSPGGTKVTAGNKILATDRSQTGTATTQYAVMKDSHFTAGTKITASAFNSAYELS